MASMVTILSFKSRLLSKSGAAVFSLDFEATFCCPKISLWSETQALNKQRPDFLCPDLAVARRTFPSILI